MDSSAEFSFGKEDLALITECRCITAFSSMVLAGTPEQ